jgi:periplasmic copper chaperone A
VSRRCALPRKWKFAQGKRVELAPKGKHLMLMGLDAPLVAGQTYTLVLQFAESGEQAVTVTVREATAEPAHRH